MNLYIQQGRSKGYIPSSIVSIPVAGDFLQNKENWSQQVGVSSHFGES